MNKKYYWENSIATKIKQKYIDKLEADIKARNLRCKKCNSKLSISSGWVESDILVCEKWRYDTLDGHQNDETGYQIDCGKHQIEPKIKELSIEK